MVQSCPETLCAESLISLFMQDCGERSPPGERAVIVIAAHLADLAILYVLL